MKSIRHDIRGVVMAEFIIALIPLMMAFLAAVQFAFVATAKLTLMHSTTVAARAAAVVIEESVALPGLEETGIYQDLPAGLVEREPTDGTRSDAQQESDLRALDGASMDGDAGSQLGSLFEVLDRDGSRLNQIRTAAYIPMMAISPNALADGLDFLLSIPGLVHNPTEVFKVWAENDNVRNQVWDSGTDEAGTMSRLIGAFVYNLGALSVTFPEPEAEQEQQNPDPNAVPESTEGDVRAFEPGEEVTVRATYLFRCRVPLVSALLCESGWGIAFNSAWLDTGTWWESRGLGDWPTSIEELRAWEARLGEIVQRRQARLDKIQEMAVDWKQVESPMVQRLLLFRPGARFLVLRAEATLPIQGAKYYPRGEQGST
ncbi:MAG: pilus assembly protein [Myxococcales bacterium]|nr:pilus assembly protein [Myxococcales bacterium]